MDTDTKCVTKNKPRTALSVAVLATRRSWWVFLVMHLPVARLCLIAPRSLMTFGFFFRVLRLICAISVIITPENTHSQAHTYTYTMEQIKCKNNDNTHVKKYINHIKKVLSLLICSLRTLKSRCENSDWAGTFDAWHHGSYENYYADSQWNLSKWTKVMISGFSLVVSDPTVFKNLILNKFEIFK